MIQLVHSRMSILLQYMCYGVIQHICKRLLTCSLHSCYLLRNMMQVPLRIASTSCILRSATLTLTFKQKEHLVTDLGSVDYELQSLNSSQLFRDMMAVHTYWITNAKDRASMDESGGLVALFPMKIATIADSPRFRFVVHIQQRYAN